MVTRDSKFSWMRFALTSGSAACGWGDSRMGSRGRWRVSAMALSPARVCPSETPWNFPDGTELTLWRRGWSSTLGRQQPPLWWATRTLPWAHPNYWPCWLVKIHSDVSGRESTFMEGSNLTPGHTIFPQPAYILWAEDAAVERQKLLALLWDISAGPSQLQSSLWPINFSLRPILLLPLNPIYYFFNLFIYLAASDLSCIICDLSLQCAGSVVVACWLSCSKACGILVPGSRIKPMSPVLQGRFLTTGPTHFEVSLIYCWQDSSISFLYPTLHLRIGFYGNPNTLFFLILSSYSFFLSLSPLSSPFPLCTEWPCLLVCWEESHLTHADPVSHQASVSFNPQKGPDLDSTVCDQNSLNSSLLHHTHILYTYYILLGAGNTDLSKRFQSSEHQTPNSYWNCQKNIIIKRHIIAGNQRKVPFSYNKLQGISPRYIAGETGLRGGSAATGVSSAFVSHIFFRRKATQGPVEVTPLACPSSEQWETGDDAGDPQFSSTMHRVLQDFQGHHSSAHLFEVASSTRGGHLREAEETLD